MSAEQGEEKAVSPDGPAVSERGEPTQVSSASRSRQLPPLAPSYFARTLSCSSFVEIGVSVFIVYILKSIGYPGKYYIGLTENLDKRLKEHNGNDNTGYSKKYPPWELETHITFKNRRLAESFEKYLKVGSGQAFLKKRLI